MSMNKIIILNLMLLLSSQIELAFSEVAEEDGNDGPISNILDKLVANTGILSNELLSQLLANNENTTKTLMDNIEVVITSALNQLRQPIENFQQNISSSQCQPLITMQELNQQINSDLSNCTENMKEILSSIQQDANEFKDEIEKIVKEIMDLRKKCETGKGFVDKINCYFGNIAGFNQQVAVILNNARETLVHARQLGETAVQEVRTCSNRVIVTTVDYLEKIVATCQMMEQ